MLTSSEANRLLEYDKTTGILRWKITTGRVSAGEIAGSLDHYGYRQVRCLGRNYKAHRVIWLMVTGAWPQCQIDHMNQVKDDNRWANLRDVDGKVNSRNTAARGRSGVKGVCSSGLKWTATIQRGQVRRYLGTFETREAAYSARLHAKKVL